MRCTGKRRAYAYDRRMRRYFGCAWLCVTFVLQSCSPKPPIAPPPAAASKSEPEPEAPAEIPEPALKQLLDQWLAAQNQGQFEAYEGLYARKFFGIKRAGPRELRFDREAWLNDRKRMFRKPMKVEAREPKFQAAITSAQVVFTQHFASGNFEDLGDKRLVVVLESGKLRIEHEEMLRSELAVPPGKPVQSAEDFFLTLTLDSGVYVSLPDVPVPAKLGGYRSEHEADLPDVYTTSRALPDQDLDPSLASLKSRTLRFEDGCEGRVSSFHAITRVIPHFAEVQRWNGVSFDDTVKTKPLGEAQITRAAYKLGVPAVFAKLDGCGTGGRFARFDSSPPPVLGLSVEDTELERSALAAFRQLPSVLESQQAYLESTEGATRHWWDGNTRTAVYEHPKSGQKVVSVVAALNAEACRDFSASTWVLYEKRGTALELLMPETTSPAEIQEALDVDGDGRLEFLIGSPGHAELIWPSRDHSGPSLSIVDLDCHC